jgi:hypothetical protein
VVLHDVAGEDNDLWTLGLEEADGVAHCAGICRQVHVAHLRNPQAVECTGKPGHECVVTGEHDRGGGRAERVAGQAQAGGAGAGRNGQEVAPRERHAPAAPRRLGAVSGRRGTR